MGNVFVLENFGFSGLIKKLLILAGYGLLPMHLITPQLLKNMQFFIHQSAKPKVFKKIVMF